MHEIDPEELLWELSSAEGDDDGEVPSDGLLRAYRAGELETEETRRVETLLARSSAARERLRELAGIAPPAPPARRRQTVPRSGPTVWMAGWLAAAAALVAVVAGLWYLGGAKPGDLPTGLDFNVTLELLADVRAGVEPEVTDAGSAYADTPVRIVVEPEETAVQGLEFGLYRRRGEAVERLTAGIDLDLGRGTAVFEAPAARLAAGGAGPQELLIAVARAGRLPESLTLTPGEDAAARLAESSGGRVYRRTFVLLTVPGKNRPAN